MAHATRHSRHNAADADVPLPSPSPAAAAAAVEPDFATLIPLFMQPWIAAQDLWSIVGGFHVQQAKALQAWTASVDEALRAVRGSPDPQALALTCLRLSGKQFALVLDQWGQASSQWMEGEWQLADRWRGDAWNLACCLDLPRSSTGAALGEAWWGQWTRFQDDWKAAAQPWLEGANATAQSDATSH